MRHTTRLMIMLTIGLMSSGVSTAWGQQKQDRIVNESITVLNEIMAIPVKGIPQNLLKDAHAVAIIPSVIKGSFIVGARHGKGVLMVRDQNNAWHAPVFLTLTGGNVGWQVGVESTDVILVFKTPRSVEGLLNGKWTIGADAAVAAGPVGRKAAAATDERLTAQIVSYSRSRGLFAGVSLDGSVINIDQVANGSYYRPGANGRVIVPQSGQVLVTQLSQYTQPRVVNPTYTPPAPRVAPSSPQQRILAEQHAKSEADHVRDQLARLAPQLYELLDSSWQQYLALPAEVFQGNSHPSREVVQTCLTRFESVRTDARYATLANHPEFQSTYGLLKHYQHAIADSGQTLNLPAPPPVSPK